MWRGLRLIALACSRHRQKHASQDLQTNQNPACSTKRNAFVWWIFKFAIIMLIIQVMLSAGWWNLIHSKEQSIRRLGGFFAETLSNGYLILAILSAMSEEGSGRKMNSSIVSTETLISDERDSGHKSRPLVPPTTSGRVIQLLSASRLDRRDDIFP